MGGALAVLVAAELARQALGPDALLTIDNVLRHEPAPAHGAPALVRELLANPLDAADAAVLFQRVIPAPISKLEIQGEAVAFEPLLERYIGELAQAQRALQAATAQGFDELAILAQLGEGAPSAGRLLEVAGAVDAAAMERANALFLEATLRFVQGIRKSDVPEAKTLSTAIGKVVIGSRGPDRHGLGAALIIDPGGDDAYRRAPALGGAVAVVIDLEGDDRYSGADVALRGFAALVDLAGNDRYEMDATGLGAAIAGASLVLDAAGDDLYQSAFFAQGAAAFGIGALVDLAGDDEYRLTAWGQGLGLAGGVGLLWDRGGHDRYSVAGAADPFNRGLLSGAQGAAFGYRTMLGGGVGILRDERGDDRYEAEMFAQGSGYYEGIGVLWDQGGNDRYRALRYAQGAGAHQALGVLRDEAGADAYELGYGVGQGMGLDLAVGTLFDGAGDDRYRARFYAQGTATANGIGLLADAAGADRLRVEDRYAWGSAEPLRGLPSVGVMLNPNAFLERVEGAPQVAPGKEEMACEDAEAVRARLAKLDRRDFDALGAAAGQLSCALVRGEMWPEAEALLARDPADPLAGAIARALPAAPPPLREQLRAALWRHPSCGVKSAVLSEKEFAEALHSTCWRLQAAALRMGANARGASLPSFLRERRAY